MGRRKTLPIPPKCPTCNIIPEYSTFPYCYCKCGNFVYEMNEVIPVDKSRSHRKHRKGYFGSEKVTPFNWLEYEISQGWEPPESEE